ncbi:MAG: methyltransferase domain-containing protein [Boseongicola sp.]|nr:methyltransferase domain-containing protein [Boseongicola sp.]
MSEQADLEAQEQSYTMGYSEEFQMLLRRRSAANCAGHLIPKLGSGMHLLDVGCGPGTISMGLADVVAPGKLTGVDIEESQIEIARSAASAGGHKNAEFQVADAVKLPFESNSFDVVHAHAATMHVPDASAAVAEMMRVLKPGGIISSRDIILSSCFSEPEHGDFDNAWHVFGKLLSANGGHPEMGKEIKGVLLATGFCDVSASASFECFAAKEDVDFFHAFASGWFFAEQTMAAAKKLGLASADDFARWRELLDQWQADPAAFAAIAWGEVLAVKPG